MTSPAALGRQPVLADLAPSRLRTEVLLISAAVALTAIAAQFSFLLPGTPVPVTGQTAAVLLAGGALGASRGAFAQLAYLAVGAAGAPVFTQGAHGPDAVLGATGGYLVAFPIAAFVVGSLASRGHDRRIPSSVLALLAGSAVIYGIGVPWLAVNLGVGLAEAANLGLWPFLAGDFVKACLAGVLLPAVWRATSKR